MYKRIDWGVWVASDGAPMQNSFEKRILDAIQVCEGIGITIQDIARLTSINRLTAAKYLAVMEARGIVQCRRIGRAKLYLPILPSPAKALDDIDTKVDVLN